MRLHLLSIAVLALAACSPPQAAKSDPVPQAEVAAPATSVEFMAPSGNIGCTYTPTGGTAIYQTPDGRAELFCDRMEPTFVRVVMSEQSPAHIVETQERGCCSGETIAYGDDWSDGPFSCDMEEAALTCRSNSGHGFTLSRAQADVH